MDHGLHGLLRKGVRLVNREMDLQWFLAHRLELARQHDGRWLVVHDGKLVDIFDAEEPALAFAVERFGIDRASVFHATAADPFVYVG